MLENISRKIIPDEIEKSLKNDFNRSDNFLFFQVGTESSGFPHIRTMRLYGIENEYGLIFLTRDTSRKWSDLKNNPHIAICILHPEYKLQLQAECVVKGANFHAEPALFEKYWKMVRTDVKKIYHENYIPNVNYQERKETDVPAVVPENFGIIMAMPHFWEYLLINSNYPDSIRYQFIKKTDGEWIKSHLTMS